MPLVGVAYDCYFIYLYVIQYGVSNQHTGDEAEPRKDETDMHGLTGYEEREEDTGANEAM